MWLILSVQTASLHLKKVKSRPLDGQGRVLPQFLEKVINKPYL